MPAFDLAVARDYARLHAAAAHVILEKFDADQPLPGEVPEGSVRLVDKYAYRAGYLRGTTRTLATAVDDLLAKLPDVDAMRAALAKAEAFIAGFEDDPDQDGVTELLHAIREQLPRQEYTCGACHGHGGQEIEHPSGNPALETFAPCGACNGLGHYHLGVAA